MSVWVLVGVDMRRVAVSILVLRAMDGTHSL